MNDSRLEKAADVARTEVSNVIDDLINTIETLESENKELQNNLETAELKLEESNNDNERLVNELEDLRKQLRDGNYAIY